MRRGAKKQSEEEEADYTPEQHLVASVTEFKKLEEGNQSYLERMYKTLSSPFKVSAKPCEADRLAVLRCYEDLFGGGGSKHENNSNSGDGRNETGGGGSSSSSGVSGPAAAVGANDMWKLPLHSCHAPAMRYEQCVESVTLGEHLALASSFEAKRVAAQARAVEDMKANERAGAAADAAAAAAAAAAGSGSHHHTA